MENVAAITFDVGNTLLQPWPSVGGVYAEVAGEHGVTVEPAVLEQNFINAWNTPREFNYTKAAWSGLVDEVFAGIANLPPSETFFDALYERFDEPATWRVYDDVLPTLKALKQRDVRLAVMSNWDNRLRNLLERLDLSRHFEALFISAELGCQKPDPQIFNQATTHLGLPGDRVLQVGESEREDYRGALAAGFQARWLRRTSSSILGGEINSLTQLIQ